MGEITEVFFCAKAINLETGKPVGALVSSNRKELKDFIEKHIDDRITCWRLKQGEWSELLNA